MDLTPFFGVSSLARSAARCAERVEHLVLGSSAQLEEKERIAIQRFAEHLD